MRISHIALWASDIERLKDFYVKHFDAVAGRIYHNPTRHFTSYFLRFPDGEVTLELMNVPELSGRDMVDKRMGFCHIALSVGSKEEVDVCTARLKAAGVSLISHPRTTGDGCYESVVADPEGNIIEITI